MARDPYIEDPDKFLDQIDTPTAWNTSRYSCFFCYRRDLPTIITTAGRMCSVCILKSLRTQRKPKDLPRSFRAEAPEILAVEGSLSRKLIFLENFTVFYPKGVTGTPEYRRQVSRNLVANLGYATDHPFADALREAVLSACRHLGRNLLPFLLEIESPSPWQFYADIVLAAGSIAPEDPGVKRLLEKAAGDSHPEVRRAVPPLLAEHTAPWAKKLMTRLAKDPDPGVKKACRNFVTRRRRQARKKELKQGMERKKAKRQPPAPTDGIQKLIQGLYTVDNLKTIIPIYFETFIEAKKLKGGGRFSLAKLKKKQMAEVAAKAFRSKKSLNKFFKPLPEAIRSLIAMLAYRPGMVSAESVEKQTGMAVIERSNPPAPYGYKQIIEPAFRLFQIHEEYVGYTSNGTLYRYFLYLDNGLRELFMKFLDPPPDYHIGPAATVEETALRFEDHGRLFAQAGMISEYIRQGHLRMSKNGQKILVSSIKKMASVCNIDEFYASGDTALCYIRTQLIGNFFLENQTENPAADAASFKHLVTELFFRSVSDDHLLCQLLHHLNGIGYANISYTYRLRSDRRTKISAALLSMLREMPVGEWVSVSRCIAYAAYRREAFEILDPISTQSYVNFRGELVSENDGISEWDVGKHRIHPGLHIDTVIAPFIKAILFLCGSLGLLDLVYDPPTNDRFRLSGKPYLSRYDGLRYVRLTELGAYVAGLSETYDQAMTAVAQARVILDENHLIINLDGRDPVKSMTLETLAERISDTCFRMSYESFLRGCSHETDVEDRIDLFESMIEDRIPAIWMDFLKDVQNRANPMEARDEAYVFQLRPDPNLLDLMARDRILKKYILKAERHHVIIQNRNLGHVKRRLAALGYFWNGD